MNNPIDSELSLLFVNLAYVNKNIKEFHDSKSPRYEKKMMQHPNPTNSVELNRSTHKQHHGPWPINHFPILGRQQSTSSATKLTHAMSK